jgi:hypothetical protein
MTYILTYQNYFDLINNNMIWKIWRKGGEDFSPYEDIKLSESEINQIKKIPEFIFDKLYQITEAELWKKVLKGQISLEEAKGWIAYSKYLRTYFSK